MSGGILPVRASRCTMTRTTFGFWILVTVVLLLCFQVASTKSASTNFALHNVNNSTIDCFGNASLVHMGDTSSSSISFQNSSSANFPAIYGYCAYKNFIQFSDDSSFSTMFSFSPGAPAPDYYSNRAKTIGFFIANKCDNGPSGPGLAPGCPGSSSFFNSSFRMYVDGPVDGLTLIEERVYFSDLQVLDDLVLGLVRENYTDKIYVWIDYVRSQSTLQVSVNLQPKKPCQGVSLISLSPQNAMIYDNLFTSRSVAGFFGNYTQGSYDGYLNYSVWDWSFSTLGPAEDIYNGSENCSSRGPALSVAGHLTEIIVPTVFGIIGVLLVTIFFLCRRGSERSKANASLIQATKRLEKDKNDLLGQLKLLTFGAREFTYKELQQATDNFADEIGRGGFGLVFKGTLPGVGTVAVKRINKTERNVEDAKQLVTEVEVIGSVRHVNIVPLHGWCHEKGAMLLVYKFIDNDNLSMHLFPQNPAAATPLAWTKRMKVLRGVASALVFLHEEFESEDKVIHRDIKPTNVMLDSEFNARLGDFGLARLSKRTEPGHQSRSMAGTFGYIAPEYSSGATTQTDVYSFGVLVLVVATAREPLDKGLCIPGQEGPGNSNLVWWVRNLHDQGLLLEAGDKTLRDGSHWSIQDSADMERVLRVGLWCCVYDPDQRPTMREALTALQGWPTMLSTSMPLHFPGPIEYPSFESWSQTFESSTKTSDTVSLLGNSRDSSYVTASQTFNVSEEVAQRRRKTLAVRFQERTQDDQDMDTITELE